MKNIRMTILAIGAAALISTAAAAAAQTAEETITSSAVPQSYAFVDMGRIMNETSVAKGVTTELTSKRQQIRSDIEQKEQTLRTEAGALVKQRSTLSREDYEKKATVIQTKIDDLGKSFKNRERSFEEVGRASLDKVRSIAANYIEQVAQERKYAAVFTREAVILGAKNLDITDEVITRMNKGGQKVSVDWNPPAKNK